MIATFPVVLPVFALILSGWLARRLGVLGPQATAELNRFVVYLALPALLFDIVANARWAAIWQPGFIVAYGGGSVLVFAATLALRLRAPGRPLADAGLDALNASYPNNGYMGFPLALVAFGREAMAPTLVALLLTVCGTFALAIVLVETGLQGEAHRGRLAWRVLRSLARNPLLVAPALGALPPLLGLGLAAPVETFLKFLGGAASPCALVALGLFLAQSRAGTDHARPAALLVALKLVGHPALTFGLARLMRLDPLLTHTAVLMAALPTGTGPFMLAEFYGREAALTGRVILVSTILSVLTVAGYLAAVG